MTLVESVTRENGEGDASWAEWGPEGSAGVYRYSLGRIWTPGLEWALFIGLNPSTADAEKNDPTIRREIEFAKAWGLGGLVKVNLFAFRATDPKKLNGKGSVDVVGPENDTTILKWALDGRVSIVIAAWGASIPKNRLDRAGAVERLVTETGRRDLHAIKLTAGGVPSHPLYLKGGQLPQLYRPKVKAL